MASKSTVSIKNLTELAAMKPLKRISLQQAARDGNDQIVRERLEEDLSSINEKDKNGYAAMHYAARFNRFKIMQLLVTSPGIDPNVRCKNGLTPLHFAAKYLPPYLLKASGELDFVAEARGKVTNLSSSLQSIQLLIKYCKCDVNLQEKRGKKTPLHLACSHGNAAAVDTLVEVPGINLNAKDSSLQTPLHNACLSGDKWIVERLLKTKQVDLFARNDDGMVPLQVACLEGQTEIVKLILLHADDREKLVSLIDTKQSTPLHLACESGIPEIVQSLLLHHADTSAVDFQGVTPMHIAAKQGFLRIAEIMLEVDGDNVAVVDDKQFTPLHYAAKFDQADMVDFLIRKGAEVDAVDEDSQNPLLIAAQYGQEKAFKRLMENGAVLDFVDKNRRSCVFLAAEHDHVGILKLLLKSEQGRRLCSGTDSRLNTPLHIAAVKGSENTLNVLLGVKGYVRVHARNEANKTPLHLAAETGHSHVCQALYKFDKKRKAQSRVDLEENTFVINDGDEDLNTPLQVACANGRRTCVKYLLRVYSDPNTRNSKLRTPAHSAAYGGWEEVLELLVEFEADMDSDDKNGVTPLQLACKKGNLKCVDVLMKNGAKVTTKPGRLNCLEVAILKGHENVARYIIESDQWIDALRNCIDGHETPMRRLIKNMPEVAEIAFTRCTEVTSDPDLIHTNEGLEVTYMFEFIEDFQHTKKFSAHHGRRGSKSLVYTMDTPAKCEEDSEDEGGDKKGCCGKKRQERQPWASEWGPEKFTKANHPLALMVKHGRTNLLKHPLVTTLLDYKWRKYTQLVFAGNFLLYFFFVLLLTAFALVVSTPQDRACMEVVTQLPSGLYNHSDIVTICESGFNVTGNCSETGFICSCASCGQVVYWPWDFTKPSQDLDSRARYWFLFISAIIITLLALLRLLMESFQLCIRGLDYITDWINWLEDILFATAVIFVWIFHNDCYCSRGWQWQVGVFAVFLSWINLILFIQKLPRTGIYVVMFLNIFYTFLKVVILSIFLVISFGLAFYMVFYKPQIAGVMISAFENPARSMFKTITMTTGELDFDSLFEHGSSISDQLPYLAASIILWIIFIILMPILLSNLLVGLAVDDIQAIQESATLERLALQVDLTLNVEAKFPQFRWRYNIRKLRTHPNRVLNPIRKTFYNVWGGRDYGSLDLKEVLDPQRNQEPLEEIQGNSRLLVADMDGVKNKVKDSFKRIREIEEKINQIASKLESSPDTVAM